MAEGAANAVAIWLLPREGAKSPRKEFPIKLRFGKLDKIRKLMSSDANCRSYKLCRSHTLAWDLDVPAKPPSCERCDFALLSETPSFLPSSWSLERQQAHLLLVVIHIEYIIGMLYMQSVSEAL